MLWKICGVFCHVSQCVWQEASQRQMMKGKFSPSQAGNKYWLCEATCFIFSGTLPDKHVYIPHHSDVIEPVSTKSGDFRNRICVS